jgi:hypothetical protein
MFLLNDGRLFLIVEGYAGGRLGLTVTAVVEEQHYSLPLAGGGLGWG